MMNVYAQRHAAWKKAGLERVVWPVHSPQGPILTLADQSCLAFCSNDYLGLANDMRVRQVAAQALEHYGVGAGASALVCGYSQPQAELEHGIATWLGVERALVFSSGYMAHLGVIPVLVDEETAVFSDALNHASLIDGIRLARPKALTIYDHDDMIQLEQALCRSTAKQRWIISDGVFSMDGDQAPVRELAELAERYGAGLLIDDAHGVGVLGPQGRGSLALEGVSGPLILQMITFGKALGTAGAAVAGEARLIAWLAQRARTHMFSTALPPVICAATLEALRWARDEEFRRIHLQQLGQRLQAGLRLRGMNALPSVSAIHPLMVGDNERVMALAAELKRQGIWVAPIRPPTVPSGTARLRISLSALHTEQQVDRLVDHLGLLWEKGG